MKKIYSTAQTKIVNIELQRMIAASDDPTVRTVTNTKAGGGEVLSRGGFWDDDEE